MTEETILVVDDEGAIRYAIGKALQSVGYQVSEAASGVLGQSLSDVRSRSTRQGRVDALISTTIKPT